MDFFSNLIRQPPVTDKHKRHDFSQYSDEFTITKQKGLRGFNDDVSQIEIGSDLINQDSINEIKYQQKLLFGQEQLSKKGKIQQQYDSKQQSFQHHQENLIDTDKSKKDKMKVSIESKLLSRQFPPPQPFINSKIPQQIHQQNNYQKPRPKYSQPLSPPPLPRTISTIFIAKSKKINTQIVINLSQLKKIKTQVLNYIMQQQSNLTKLINTIRQNIQTQIKQQFTTYAKTQQTLITNNIKKMQKGQQIALKSKLKQSQDLIKQMQKQLQQSLEENQMLQQKLFDMQQKMVGIDLQVEEKFQKKRKQLQAKICQQFMTKYSNNNQCITQNNQQQHQQNTQNLTNLINQNKQLQQKLKSYQTLLLQTDHIRRAKQQVQQLQFTLNQREQLLIEKQKQAQKKFMQANKKSIDLEHTENSINNKLNQLKQKLQVKELYLQKWQQQLQSKQNKFNQQQMYTSNYNTNKHIPPLSQQDQFPSKRQTINFKKSYNQQNNKIQTSRHHKTQCSQDSSNHRPQPSNIVGNNRPTIAYDPKKHQKYQQFDSQQRDKFYYNVKGNDFNKQRQLKTQRPITPPKSIDILNYPNTNRGSVQFSSNKSDINVVNRPKMESIKINYKPIEAMRKNVDFYKPSMTNSFKYEPQYGSKPQSIPINSKTLRVDSYRNLSPHHQRQNSVSSYNKSSVSSNRLTADFRDRHYHPSNDRSTFSKSSMDNSFISGQSQLTNRINYLGYDMKKSKNKYQVTKLNDLGNKIQFLKSQLKSQIDHIL